jgi:transposase
LRYKRLEEERFRWPFHLEGPVVTLEDQEFAWLLEGLDLRHLKPHRALEYRTVL